MQNQDNKFHINVISQRIPELDGFRGFALIMTILWHYYVCELTGYNAITRFFKPLTDLTWIGVDLFFVLSGFLIASILLESRQSPNYFKTFYVRRICRIFPMYYFIYALFLIGIWLGGEQAVPFIFQNPLPLWSYGVFAQNFFMGMVNGAYNFGPHFMAVTWSVTIEEQFYLVMPLLIWLTPSKHIIKVCLGLIAVCWGFKFLFMQDVMRTYTTMLTRMDSLLIGVMIAHLIKNPEFIQGVFKLKTWLYLLLPVQLILLHFQNFSVDHWYYGFTFTQAGLMFANFMLLILVDRNGPLGKFCKNHFLQWLGAISYGTYLSHQAINGLMHKFILHQNPTIHLTDYGYDIADISITITSILLSLLFAHYAFRWFEKPLIKKGHRFKY